MTPNTLPPQGPTPENMVSYSEQLLSLSIERLTQLLQSHDTPPGWSKELSEEFRSLRKALEIAYHERAQLQKLKGADGAHASALDLGAARDEIHRRLARLRATSDSGAIPRQSE